MGVRMNCKIEHLGGKSHLQSVYVYLGIFELGVSIRNGQATQSKLTVYTGVEPLDGFGCVSRRGAGRSREAFFCLSVEK